MPTWRAQTGNERSVQAVTTRFPDRTADCVAIDQMLATVPDLITVLDSQNGTALGTPDYR